MRRRMLIFVATMMVTVSALAQKLNVRGTVIDENKEAVIGASVLIKGSNIGTKTDIYGQFLLDGVKSGSELVISYVGMKTKTVQARSSLSIVLENDDQILDEVMVVAFGEQKKSSFTGSAGVVDSKKLEQRQVTNVMEALQGNVAGLQAYSHSGPLMPPRNSASAVSAASMPARLRSLCSTARPTTATGTVSTRRTWHRLRCSRMQPRMHSMVHAAPTV